MLDFKDVSEKNKCNLIEQNNYLIILDVGCGTSLFSYDLKNTLDSPSFLVCVDFSDNALEMIKKKHESQKTNINTKYSIDYVKCDCKRLPFRNDIYDLIIEKGYLDSVLKGENIVDSIKNFLISTNNIVEKLNIKRYSCLLSITDETPESRLSLLDELDQSNYKLSLNYKEIILQNNTVLFVYYLYKKKR